MSIIDHESSFSVDFPKLAVYRIALDAMRKDNSFKVLEANPLTGFIKLAAGVSLWSWGENITVSFHDRGPQATEISVLSTPKTGIMFGGAIDMGKNRQNIDKIRSCISNALVRAVQTGTLQMPQPSPPPQPQRRMVQGPFNVACPFCQVVLACPPEAEGQTCNCPQCGNEIIPLRQS